MEDIHSTLEEIKRKIADDQIHDLPKKDLLRYLSALCYKTAAHSFNPNQFPQVCETIRLQLLQKFIEETDEKNTKLQIIVVLVSIMALVCTAAQVYIALKTPSVCTVIQQKEKLPQELKPIVTPARK